MEKADSCRRAAYDAVADVEPPELHDYIEASLAEASMVPGVLTIESAAATATDGHSVLEADAPPSENGAEYSDELDDTSGVATQAAGVQLIYEGLRLTRVLAHDEPWIENGAGGESAETGDLEILAADILVARGFYLLARTDAAGKAVRTVQAFGRDQSRRTMGDGGETDPATIDANLERDILELAVLTGAAAVGETPSPRLLATVDEIADRVEAPFPPAATYLADLEPTRSEQSLEEHPTDRATSATDP
ncbi:DUF7114 family protein [Natronorubrum texcoconense]|uniref:Uncharacterized protein n=1 Tax=Natronorubrum texcoconense TaxID=1095776 RepID=A0A1G9C5P6_9EURY|nr:hypothetical protein [Natronorubrum texcoconense]SDK46988.1 hypothetical protein SAMN04515672_3225 [Natronorubrum texcoconense]